MVASYVIKYNYTLVAIAASTCFGAGELFLAGEVSGLVGRTMSVCLRMSGAEIMTN